MRAPGRSTTRPLLIFPGYKIPLPTSHHPLSLSLYACSDDPESLREQLKEVIDLEAGGKMNPSLRLRKKALQAAYDMAIKRQMVRAGVCAGTCVRVV